MFLKKICAYSGVCLCVFLLVPSASADLVTFSNGDTLDQDVVGDSAGPFSVGLSGQPGILTTRGINGGTSMTGPPEINTTNGKLDIDSGNANPDSTKWDAGESWTFDFDVDSRLFGLNLTGMSNGDVFTVQSDALIGFGPGVLGGGISFDAITGTFTIDGNAHNGNVSEADLGGPTPVITAGVDVAFSMESGSVSLHTMSFGGAVPEPSMLAALLLPALTVLLRRRKEYLR